MELLGNKTFTIYYLKEDGTLSHFHHQGHSSMSSLLDTLWFSLELPCTVDKIVAIIDDDHGELSDSGFWGKAAGRFSNQVHKLETQIEAIKQWYRGTYCRNVTGPDMIALGNILQGRLDGSDEDEKKS